MAQISTNEFKSGLRVEIDGQPYIIVSNQFVKPGKGGAFNRVKLKHLISGRTLEKNIKSGIKVDLADAYETDMRMLYTDMEGAVFMDESTYDQMTIPNANLGDAEQWLQEDLMYTIVFYNGQAVIVTPPTFLNLKVTETDPGARGDTASGRVLKPAKVETGATVQVPIFIEQDEIIKVDTRTGEYVSRASE